MDASTAGFVRLFYDFLGVNTALEYAFRFIFSPRNNYKDKGVALHYESWSKLVYKQATCGIGITGMILSMENMSKMRLSKLEGICLVASIL